MGIDLRNNLITSNHCCRILAAIAAHPVTCVRPAPPHMQATCGYPPHSGVSQRLDLGG
jgi:hypothetical protein